MRRATAPLASGDPRTAAAPGQPEGGRGSFDMAGLRAAVEALEGSPDISWQLGQLLPKYDSTTSVERGASRESPLFCMTRLSHKLAE